MDRKNLLYPVVWNLAPILRFGLFHSGCTIGLKFKRVKLMLHQFPHALLVVATATSCYLRWNICASSVTFIS